MTLREVMCTEHMFDINDADAGTMKTVCAYDLKIKDMDCEDVLVTEFVPNMDRSETMRIVLACPEVKK
jgi:hypothetical protein